MKFPRVVEDRSKQPDKMVGRMNELDLWRELDAAEFECMKV